ncbi:unnamed protein product [Mytilus coruscus]|uniref:Uncharacterized protein n=1 Tax=Mytilus coruscus TaxID=42192 RepID=A0A6J8E8R7_MYTCO|nr:unnamed protein product [Mytilus coruscus]
MGLSPTLLREFEAVSAGTDVPAVAADVPVWSQCLPLALMKLMTQHQPTSRFGGGKRIATTNVYQVTRCSTQVARSGKICRIRIDSDFLGLLKVYATHLSQEDPLPDKPQPYLFLTSKGEFLMPSLVQTGESGSVKEQGLRRPPQPPVETEAGGYYPQRERAHPREENVELTKHKTHNVATADIYYDQSRRAEGRHAVLDKLSKAYKVN